MNWLFLVVCCLTCVELLMRLGLPGRLRRQGNLVAEIRATIRSSILDDQAKEAALLKYAWHLFSSSLLLSGLLIASFSPFLIFSIVLDFLGQGFLDLLFSTAGILMSTLIAFFYGVIRWPRPDSPYGPGSRILHRVVLGSRLMGETVFGIELAYCRGKTRDVSQDRHVFVAGLARAGTTILMRRLYESGGFCTLTYRDMPFVMAPNLWRILSRRFRRRQPLRERAHGDGILVDLDSPEALEEVFWRVFCASQYIGDTELRPMRADEETLTAFRRFVSVVLRDDAGRRYLSKNNNNLLRLESIEEAFPNAVIVIPFREPIEHAISLLRQHRRFVKEHARDAFSKRYMAWLVHHEFGADHRPFVFDGRRPSEGLSPDYPDYWLEFWVNTYAYVLDHMPTGSVLLSYDRLCESPREVWAELATRLDIPPYCPRDSFRKSCRRNDFGLPSEALAARAAAIHEGLLREHDRSVG